MSAEPVIHDADFGVRLPHEDAERLRVLAVRNGTSVSAEVRQVMDSRLNELALPQ